MSTAKFNGDSPLFKPEGTDVSRYDAAKATWDNRIGSARQQAYNWRLFSMFALLLCIILALGLIYQSSKSSVTPYVIEVDSTTGMARNIGPAKETAYVPKDAEIQYFIWQFVLKTRSVPLDPVLYTQNWNHAYLLMNKNAAAKMNQVMQNEEQSQQFGKQTVLPTHVITVPVTKDTYQVRWTEEQFDLNGGKKAIVPMTGVFTIEFGKPKNESELLYNPLGLYILDFNWGKDRK